MHQLLCYVWTHLFQICQKHFWNVQTKSPGLTAAGCFISLGSHTRRPSTTICFHSWELRFATGVRARMKRKPQCFLPRCYQPFQESLVETVKRTEKDCCHSMRFLMVAEGPQPAQLWRTTSWSIPIAAKILRRTFSFTCLTFHLCIVLAPKQT